VRRRGAAGAHRRRPRRGLERHGRSGGIRPALSARESAPPAEGSAAPRRSAGFGGGAGALGAADLSDVADPARFDDVVTRVVGRAPGAALGDTGVTEVERVVEARAARSWAATPAPRDRHRHRGTHELDTGRGI
jgi:hypothetical protein